MNNLETMKQALEALKYIHEGANNQGPHTGISWGNVSAKAAPAITALRLAIEQAEKTDNNDGPINDGWQLSVSDGHSGRGVYAYMVEYPEEGAVFLMPIEQAEKYDQTALELCGKCGWKTLIPGDCCLNCVRQAEKQEPVAWGYRSKRGQIMDCVAPEDHGPTTKEFNVPLYAAPQPLTEAERNHLWETLYDHGNGKYMGEQSRAQRERAFEILKRIGGGE
jgi:hypothetical protein